VRSASMPAIEDPRVGYLGDFGAPWFSRLERNGAP
jgi:hypothetical protein